MVRLDCELRDALPAVWSPHVELVHNQVPAQVDGPGVEHAEREEQRREHARGAEAARHGRERVEPSNPPHSELSNEYKIVANGSVDRLIRHGAVVGSF